MRKIKIIKNKSDVAAGTRGSDLGIDAIEIAAINKKEDLNADWKSKKDNSEENWNYFDQYESVTLPIPDKNIYFEKNTTLKAKRIKEVLKVCTNLSNEVKNTIESNDFPLVISGDHSSALGTISGAKLAHPNKKLGVVWIDAHADVHSPYTTPSGNIHGMPLSAALADNNLDRQINKPTEETKNYWEQLSNIGGLSPKISAKDIVYFGVRDTEEPEDYFIDKNGIKNYVVEEVRLRGLATCLDEAINKLKDCDHIYISFDVDSMDCELVSKGTGTPVNKGFTQEDVIYIINRFIATNKVSCIEIVEINPLLDDKQNKMAETAFDVLCAITNNIEAQLSL